MSDSIGPHLRACLARHLGKIFRARIVRIDHCNPRSRIDRAVEQQPLGREVLLHRVVIIEMVAGQVSKDGHIKTQTDGAALVECVA